MYKLLSSAGRIFERWAITPAATIALSEDGLTRADDLPEIVIDAKFGWSALGVRELWERRELLFLFVWRDVKARYKQTLLGATWAVLQPTLMMLVFSIFLGCLAGLPTGGTPYPVFVYSGLLPWTIFASILQNGSHSVVASEHIIRKVYFPRLAIPLGTAGLALLDFVISCGMLAILMLYYGVTPRWTVLVLPVVVILLTLAGLGMGTLLAAMNVIYRDVRHLTPLLVQLWMFATPSIYLHVSDLPAVPAAIRLLLKLNPVTGLVVAFRAALLGDELPWSQLGFSAAASVGMFLLGCYSFRRLEKSFADII